MNGRMSSDKLSRNISLVLDMGDGRNSEKFPLILGITCSRKVTKKCKFSRTHSFGLCVSIHNNGSGVHSALKSRSEARIGEHDEGRKRRRICLN